MGVGARECVFICLSMLASVNWSAFKLVWRSLYASLCVHSARCLFQDFCVVPFLFVDVL